MNFIMEKTAVPRAEEAEKHMAVYGFPTFRNTIGTAGS